MICLRPVEEKDHKFLVELHNDPIVLHNITNPTPITFEDHLNWWNNLNKTREERLIFTFRGEQAGFVKFYSIDKINHNCVLGADLHKNFRGMGLAKYMWNLMLKHAFNNLNLFRVSLTTAEYNHIAIKVYKQLGFVEEGRYVKSLLRDKVYFDQILMYMTIEFWNQNKLNKDLLSVCGVNPQYTSQMCSNCGHLNKDLSLSNREWQCLHCQTQHDRDINAAKNVLPFGQGLPD